MTDWLYIENAPKNGERILGSDGKRVQATYWSVMLSKWQWIRRIDGEIRYGIWEPSIWKPRPPDFVL